MRVTAASRIARGEALTRTRPPAASHKAIMWTSCSASNADDSSTRAADSSLPVPSSAGSSPQTRAARRSRNRSAIPSRARSGASPSARSVAIARSVAAGSPAPIADATSFTMSSGGTPSTRSSRAASSRPSAAATTRSRMLSPSRIDPFASRATRRTTASSASMDSLPNTAARCSAIRATEIGRKSNRWQRLWMVGRTLWGSVVQRMNFTCDGGSSMVLSSALNAALESM